MRMMNKRSTTYIWSAAAVLLILSSLVAVSEAEENGSGSNDNIKPYDEVVTDKFETKPGLFFAHTDGEKLLYEIPARELGKDMLWITQISQTQAGHSYAGMPVRDRTVRWERRGDNILLRDVRYTIRADVDDPIAIAVERTSVAPIIKVFPIKAWGKDRAPVIDVSELFTTEVAEFSAANRVGGSSIDSGRTFLEQVKSFPRNIEVKVLATFNMDRGQGGASSGITAIVHHSMTKLPENPMTPRRWDSRVGYFNVRFQDFGDSSNHELEDIRYITRWRLEKKDPDAELSEPVQPIVWYVGPAVPNKWRPYVRAGIEMWQPAFEAAGFKNAIIAKEPPDPREDPDWDPEDARYSTIRWLPSSTANAFGPHVNDPRTGEILNADVRMYHNVMKLVRDWYFVQASPNDERAQKLPMPDDLMGELIQFVVAHEVGHSIGLPHNMKASSAYSIEQLRDPEWTAKYGTAPSIMDYARFNYVAQPGDGAALLPAVGPYDHFAIEWGYRQFPKDADDKEELEKIVARQIDEPMFRFGNASPVEDPTRQTEDLGDDAVEATRLGLANLKRVSGYLVEATSNPGQDYSLLSNMYDQLLGQWSREMAHVANVVGGVEEINLYFGDADRRYHPIGSDKQREAVQFLLENALATPSEAFVSEDILLRLEAAGSPDRMLSRQASLLRLLLHQNRIKRMAELAERNGDTYTSHELFRDITDGLWSELNGDQPSIDVYRRNLQRTHVGFLASLIENPAADTDAPALARLELEVIRDQVNERNGSAANEITEAHLRDIAARIERALNGD